VKVRVVVAEDGSTRDKGVGQMQISMGGVTLLTMKKGLAFAAIKENCPPCSMGSGMNMFAGTQTFNEIMRLPKLDLSNPNQLKQDLYSIDVNITGDFGASGSSFDEYAYSYAFGEVDGKKDVRLTATDGTKDTIFAISGPGTGYVSIPTPGQKVVDLSFTGTTQRSVPTADERSDITIGNISADAVVGGLAMGEISVDGGTIGFPGGIGTLALANVSNSYISVGTGPATTFELDNLTDVSIQAAGGIKSFNALDWLDTDLPRNDLLQAPFINGLQIKGDAGSEFDANVTLAGPVQSGKTEVLGKVHVLGSIKGGTWTINGDTDTIRAGHIAGTSFNSTGTIKSLKAIDLTQTLVTANFIQDVAALGDKSESLPAAATDLTLILAGHGHDGKPTDIKAGVIDNMIISTSTDYEIGNILCDIWDGGVILGGSVNKISASKSLEEVTLKLDGGPTAKNSLGTLAVGSPGISKCNITLVNDVLAVRTGAFEDSTLKTAGNIGIFSIRSSLNNPDQFDGSTVVAGRIGLVSVRGVSASSQGDFGFRAKQILSYVRFVDGAKPIHVQNPDTTGAFDTAGNYTAQIVDTLPL
jgi:hypothetical protein